MKYLQNLMVAILFAGAVSIVSYFTIISDFGPFAPPGHHMVLFFENGGNLHVGSRVKVLGVDNGMVADVRLSWIDKNNKPVSETDPKRYRRKPAITVALKNPIKLYENYQINVINDSLLAARSILIVPGRAIDPVSGTKHRQLKLFTVSELKLKANNSTALDMAIQSSQVVLSGDKPQAEELKDMTIQGKIPGDPVKGFTNLIEENRDNFTISLRNIREVSAKVKNGKGTIGQLVVNDELYRELKILVTDAEVLVDDFREDIQDSRDKEPAETMFSFGIFIAN